MEFETFCTKTTVLYHLSEEESLLVLAVLESGRMGSALFVLSLDRAGGHNMAPGWV